MKIYGFTNESIVDGPGIRIVVFAQGCDNACPHCHNPESWDIGGGEEYTPREIIKKIKVAMGSAQTGALPFASSRPSLKPSSKAALSESSTTSSKLALSESSTPPKPRKKAPSRKVRGVTFSGGEPFLQASDFVHVAKAVRRLGLDIATYTGNTYEVLSQSTDESVQELLGLTDYLIEGPYIHEKRDIGLKFRGSTNQRIIDMNETRRAGEIVLYDEKS